MKHSTVVAGLGGGAKYHKQKYFTIIVNSYIVIRSPHWASLGNVNDHKVTNYLNSTSS